VESTAQREALHSAILLLGRSNQGAYIKIQRYCTHKIVTDKSQSQRVSKQEWGKDVDYHQTSYICIKLYGLDDWAIEVRSPAEAKGLFL
jgi:hypothetical protein